MGQSEKVQKFFFLEIQGDMRSVINSFCILEKQGKIKSPKMENIWKYEEKASSRILENTISGIENIGMNDLVLEIINNRSSEKEKEKWTANLLDSYNVGQAKGKKCRNWWDVQDDGYIMKHLARHLRQSENTEELQNILCDVQWILKRK